MVPKLDVIKETERRFLPAMHKMGDELKHEFPQLNIHVRSYPIGSLTDFQGYMMAVECFFSKAQSEHPDSIALSICIRHITTLPELESVDVCWVDGTIEKELSFSSKEITEERLLEIENQLPKLYEVLKDKVRQPSHL